MTSSPTHKTRDVAEKQSQAFLDVFILKKRCVHLLGLELTYSFEDFIEFVGEVCADGDDAVLTYSRLLG